MFSLLYYLLLLSCDQNTQENTLKKEGFIWLAVSEGSVHGGSALGTWAEHHGSGSCDTGDSSLALDRKWRGRKGWATSYNLQSHASSNLLPPVRPHLRKFPETPKLAAPAGEPRVEHGGVEVGFIFKP
jgi:hypothetical protein